MRKAFFPLSMILFISILLTSCGKRSNSGELVGTEDRKGYKGINPYGMTYIPSGSTLVGQSGEDVFSTYQQRPKQVSLAGFFIDETEITNNEYRQFVQHVKDSIAHSLLGDFLTDDNGNDYIDYEFEIDWSDPTLDELFYQGDMAIVGNREWNTSKLRYKYKWIDWKVAASSSFDGVRKGLIKEDETEIYPDTLVWIRDFTYSYNEPYSRNYFNHPAFDDYPVVGVSWKQAKAFCAWRTEIWNTHKKDQPNSETFRLPTEIEWEYAARGGHNMAPYPWGGPYIRNGKGCLLANFKPGRGNYPEDGGMYTVKADAYFPNDYGLYNMAGNVAEWTESAYYPQSYVHAHDMNPNLKYDAKDTDPEALKRKVIRGGSWKDISYFCQVGTRNWEYQDTAKSYIGFRCALSFLGRSLNDFK